jgi:hypothetical protein
MVKKGVAAVALIGGGITALALVFARSASGGTHEWCCPYCGECFPTYEDLVAHIQEAHPGARIPLPINWD